MTYLSNMKKQSLIEKLFDKRSDPKFEIKSIHSDSNHDWGKWELNYDFKIGEEWPKGIYTLQVRRCEGCGFRQFNLQKLLI